MEAIVKTDTTKSPWIGAYCPSCNNLIQPKDSMYRKVNYCHLCGEKVEFNGYYARLKAGK